MARRRGLLSGATAFAWALIALGCDQRITAPGACPEFCPTGEIQIIDTVLSNVIDQDVSFDGYIQAHEATAMQVVGGAGAGRESRVLIRFGRFSSEVPVTTTTTAPIASRDSFELKLVLSDRRPGVSGRQLTVFRIPLAIDTMSTFASVAPFFDDSLIVGVLAIPDSSESDTVSAVFPAAAFPTFVEDERQLAVGLAIRGGAPAFVTIRSGEGFGPASLIRYVTAEGDPQTDASDSRTVDFDTFVHEQPAPAQPATLTVGGTPSSRSFLRFNLDSTIIDSTKVIGAKLLLVPVEPALGAPGDSFNVIANALSADFGPKSPLIVAFDTTAFGSAVAVGSTDTIIVDITPIVEQWQRNQAQDRTLVLRLRREAGTIAELRVGSSLRVGAEPALRLTFIPRFSFQQR